MLLVAMKNEADWKVLMMVCRSNLKSLRILAKNSKASKNGKSPKILLTESLTTPTTTILRFASRP